MIDALHWAARNLGPGTGRALPQLDGRQRILLVTAHRRESFGAPLTDLCHALNDLVERHRDIDLVYPVHANPEVQRTVRGVLRPNDRLHLIPPLEYWHLVDLLQRSYLVLTDSGGIQEEAPSLGKPVLVLRDTTERPEGINAGTARLVGTSRGRIVEETERLLDDPKAYALMARAQSPYGDGQAAGRIAKILSAAIRPTAQLDHTRQASAQ